MKKLLLSSIAFLSLSTLAPAEPNAANQLGQTLGRTFCGAAREIYANGIYIVPMAAYEPVAIETYNDILVCKNAMAQAVRSDPYCLNLFYGRISGLTRDSYNSIVQAYRELQGSCRKPQ